MQDEDGSFWIHQAADGQRFGDKYGNINFYASTALWYYNWVCALQQVHPALFPPEDDGAGA